MQSQNVFSKNQRITMILIAAVIVLTFTVSAQSVPSFTDYSPPDHLYYGWGDYIYGTNDSMAMNNSPTGGTPRETASYPYRAIFYGRTGSAESTERMFVVYSKQPVTDLFTFTDLGTSGSYGKSGRIRASVSRNRVNHDNVTYGDEILIHGPFANGSNASEGAFLGGLDYTNFNVTTSSHGTDGTKVYFNFDFFYDCASEHQQGAHDLQMNGLTSVSSVPYEYIIHCEDHTGYTGGSGGGSSGGGSSSGGSSGGGNDGLSGDRNTGGDDGRHGWGTGDYGGGVKDKDIDTITDGGSYANRPDLDASVGDDWKSMPYDNYNKMPDSEYVPDFPAYIPAEGDTGETGENWDLPEFDVNGGVFGEIAGFKDLVPNGKQGLIDFMAPMEEW